MGTWVLAGALLRAAEGVHELAARAGSGRCVPPLECLLYGLTQAAAAPAAASLFLSSDMQLLLLEGLTLVLPGTAASCTRPSAAGQSSKHRRRCTLIGHRHTGWYLLLASRVTVGRLWARRSSPQEGGNAALTGWCQ